MKSFFLSFLILLSCTPGKNETVSSDTAEIKDSVVANNDDPDLQPAKEESEEEETERLAREKYEEDEKAFAELGTYDGVYALSTESEGAVGSMELRYNGEKVFTFKLTLTVPDLCTSNINGEIMMDRTQHGLYQNDKCLLHFNFMGNWGDSGHIVEIEQPGACDLMQGDCILTGRYLTGGG